MGYQVPLFVVIGAVDFYTDIVKNLQKKRFKKSLI